VHVSRSAHQYQYIAIQAHQPVLRYVHDWYARNLANAPLHIFITRCHYVALVLPTQNIQTVAANQLSVVRGPGTWPFLSKWTRLLNGKKTQSWGL